MKQYGIWQAFFLSFFSASLYRDVAHRWVGTAVLYLFLLIALASLVTLFSFMRYVSLAHSPEVSAYIGQLPTFTFHQGAVSIDKPVPYSITNPTTSRIVALIDTSGKITPSTDVNIPFVLLRDRLIVKDNEFKTTIYNLSNIKDMVITQQMVVQFVEKMHLWMFFIFWPLAFLASFLFRVTQSWVYGFLGYGFSRLTNSGLNYRQCLRVAMVSITPVVVISSIFEILLIDVQYQNLMFICLGVLYVFFGVIANQNYTPPAIDESLKK